MRLNKVILHQKVSLVIIVYKIPTHLKRRDIAKKSLKNKVIAMVILKYLALQVFYIWDKFRLVLHKLQEFAKDSKFYFY